MRWRRILTAVSLIIVLVGMTATGLFFSIKHLPHFYVESAMPEGEMRRVNSIEFLQRVNSIYNNYPDWGEVITTDQINSFFQEDLVRSWGGDANFPDRFHDPRIQFENGRLLVGIRYLNGFLSSIVSIDARVWLVANEVNMIGIEILDLKLGMLPISRQIILDFITEMASRHKISCKWYRHNGNPAAILKLQADKSTPTMVLKRFQLQQGKMIIVRHSL